MKKFLKIFVVVLVLIVAGIAAVFYFTKYKLASIGQDYFEAQDVVTQTVGVVKHVSVDLSQYSDRYVFEITGDQGRMLAAADIDLERGLLSRIAYCTNDGALIMKTSDVRISVNEEYCK